MKDYIIMHACGLEQYETDKKTAFSEARKHKRLCQLDNNDLVFVDESSDKELTGNFWKF